MTTGFDGALRRRARESREWMMDACFPLWAEHGVGPDGAFLEHLDLRGRPVDDMPGRVRVHARQGYVFATAAQLGWQPASAVALVGRALETLTTRCRREDGLFGRRIAPGGGLTTPDADLYDTAFAIYAFAHAARVLPDRAGTLALAEATMNAVRTRMADPYGGFAEALPRPAFRLQNPHMHLLEASLAMHETTGAPAWLELAADLVHLCETQFFEPRTGTLGETFRPDWLRVSGDRDDIVEPGHHFEWVWLFEAFATRAGTPVSDAAAALYRFALSTLDEEGHPCTSVRRSGERVDTTRRSWLQTEALKAHLAMLRRGDREAGARAVACFDQLMDEHLTPEGGWRDHLDAGGKVITDLMPASIGYHVVLAMVELIATVEGFREA